MHGLLNSNPFYKKAEKSTKIHSDLTPAVKQIGIMERLHSNEKLQQHSHSSSTFTIALSLMKIGTHLTMYKR